MVMVFSATFNNISAISWQSVLLVEETGVPDPEKTTDLPQVTDNFVSSTPRLINSNISSCSVAISLLSSFSFFY
jgi:hypothetical protein